MCRRRLTSAVTGFNDYNRPLIDLETVDDFVDTAARVFPNLWLHLCNLRGVDGNRHKGDSVSIQRRKRQVLLQLMVLNRMRNCRAFKWWSVTSKVLDTLVGALVLQQLMQSRRLEMSAHRQHSLELSRCSAPSSFRGKCLYFHARRLSHLS